MKTIKKQDIEIKIFSHPKEMSIGRYSQFQVYLSSELNIEFLQSSLMKAKAFSEELKKEDCEVEIENSLQAVLSLQNGVNMLTYAFAIMVAEIGGKVANDTTPEGLQLVINQIESLNITQFEIESEISELKKKLN